MLLPCSSRCYISTVKLMELFLYGSVNSCANRPRYFLSSNFRNKTNASVHKPANISQKIRQIELRLKKFFIYFCGTKTARVSVWNFTKEKQEFSCNVEHPNGFEIGLSKSVRCHEAFRRLRLTDCSMNGGNCMRSRPLKLIWRWKGKSLYGNYSKKKWRQERVRNCSCMRFVLRLSAKC